MVTASAVVGAKPTSTSAKIPNRTSAYLKCNDEVDLGAFKNTQWIACSEAELKRTEARLNIAYRKLKSALSNPQQLVPDADRNREAKLLLSQRSWQKFRDDFCEFRAGSGEAPNREVIEIECRIDITRDQIKQLEGSL